MAKGGFLCKTQILCFPALEVEPENWGVFISLFLSYVP